MTAPWLPAPRLPLDDQLEEERAAAAAVTVRDRREHEAVAAALAAVERLQAAT